MGLLAYMNPETSILSYLFQCSWRTSIADQVNIAILNIFGQSTRSSLEILIQQLMNVQKTHSNLTHGISIPIDCMEQ
jgi:hypothetical protein